MTTNPKKLFVLDTNVILHDSECLHQFKDNDLLLPIVVLEELDHFKKGNESINYQAREFLRALDAISGEKIFSDGVKLGPNMGTLRIRLERNFHPDLTFSFNPTRSDHHILNTAYCAAREMPDVPVILVSKDVNLRMKAKAVGLQAEDYTKDHVKDVSALYRGHRILEGVDDAALQALINEPEGLEPARLGLAEALTPHEYVIARNAHRSALGVMDPATQRIRRVDKMAAYGITPRNAEQTFALDALMDDHVQLVSLTGKAGTGKTLLALAGALQKMKNYRQIYMARPVVPLSNKDLGYLPGDVQAKLEPYMQPLYDNLGVIRISDSDTRNRQITTLLEEEKLVISPLSYIRGRSLVKIFFIVDEAQNLTPHEVKTIITRAGAGTKVVLTGDIFQIDHPYLDTNSNGLSYLIEKMQGQNIYAHINLEKGERSELADLASNLL